MGIFNYGSTRATMYGQYVVVDVAINSGGCWSQIESRSYNRLAGIRGFCEPPIGGLRCRVALGRGVGDCNSRTVGVGWIISAQLEMKEYGDKTMLDFPNTIGQTAVEALGAQTL